MKTTTQKIALLIAVYTLLFTTNINAQAGSTCGNPLTVTNLPFNDAGNTSSYGDNYDNADVPTVASGAVTNGTGSNYYISGDDVVYAYTPACDQQITISTTNDNDWIGLWAFEDCPFSSTVGYHTSTSGTTREISNLAVTAGQTYYFVVSTWSSPQSTDYTISIAEETSCGTGPCASTIPMSCGTAYTAILNPGSGEWDNYTDVSYSYTGSEQVWSFTPLTTGSYTFNVDQGTADADFFLMDACSNTATNLSNGYWTGSGGTTHNVTLTGGVTYYLIGDLVSFASSSTTVTVSVDCPTVTEPCNDLSVNTTLFSQSGLTTCGSGDDFSSSDVCGSSYMNGEDFVIEYTPNTTECIDIALTNTGTWTGVFLTDECPSSSSATCIGSATESSGNPTLSGMNVVAGQTYYITISTWPSPDCTPFGIDITACPPPGGGTPPGGGIIPTACANDTYTMTASSTTHFYDDGGPGGNCSTDGAAGNFANAGCETVTTICAASGEYLTAEFLVLSMFGTNDGFDWMVIYDGPSTSAPILYDNRSGGPNNPDGTSCNYTASSLINCSTGECLTFRFYASSVVNREGWDALMTSTPIPCSPLPVELTFFTGNKTGNINHLSWETATETNNDYFILEHSVDGFSWSEITKMNGAGNSTKINNYSFDHRDFPKTINYYRLTQVDFDGKRETFGIVTIDNTTDRKLIKTVNMIGQEVNENYKGMVIDYYDDNTVVKRYQK